MNEIALWWFLVVLFSVREVSGRSSSHALSRVFKDITQALFDSTCELSAIFITSDNKSVNSAILDQSLTCGVPFTVRHLESSEEKFELNSSAVISTGSIDELIAPIHAYTAIPTLSMGSYDNPPPLYEEALPPSFYEECMRGARLPQYTILKEL